MILPIMVQVNEDIRDQNDLFYVKAERQTFIEKYEIILFLLFFCDTFSNLTTIRAGIWSKRFENTFLTSARL